MSENIENLKSVLKIQILANTTQTTLSRNDISAIYTWKNKTRLIWTSV